MCKALGLVPNTAKKKTEKEKERKTGRKEWSEHGQFSPEQTVINESN